MDTGLLHLHSSFRWLIFIFLAIAIIKSLSGWLGKKEFTKSDNIVALILLSVTHLQLMAGGAIYFMKGWNNHFTNMSDPTARFWGMEHGLTMLIVITLITIGRFVSKKATDNLKKHKIGVIYYAIALVLILWAGIFKPMLLGKGLI
jgi:hypothetical protein